jgi:ABC-type uncharacterized transport system permease subunit
MTDRQWFLLAVVFYGAAAIYSIFVFRKGFRKDDWVNYGLIAAGLVCHMAAMVTRGFTFQRCPTNNLYEATLFLQWTMVVAYLVIGALPRLRFLGAFLAPVLLAIGVFALMPQLDPPYGAKPNFSGGLSSLHKALILLSYGAFGFAAVAGLMYLTQERDLKFHKTRALLSRLPPIQRLEIVMSRLIIAGFVLLTGGLVISALYLHQTMKVYFTADALAVYSFCVWLLYGGLVVARWRFAQRGRRMAMSAVGSFAFIMLTFWGIFLLSGIHNR